MVMKSGVFISLSRNINSYVDLHGEEGGEVFISLSRNINRQVSGGA